MENYVLVSVRTRLGSLRIVKEVARVGRVTPLRAIPKVREMRGGILPVGDEVRRLIFIPNIANGWKLPTLSQEQLPALSRGAATGFVFLILGNRKSSIDTLRDESEAGRSVNLTKGNHHGSGSN